MKPFIAETRVNMSRGGAPIASQISEEDYELFNANNREDTRKGKAFAYFGGLCGLVGVGYMARNFKNRPKDMKVSVYLIHTRLFAQGTVIGEFDQLISR